MGGVKVRRLRCIAGRYFWRPTPAIRRLGFANEALGSDLGHSMAQSVDRSLAANGKASYFLRGHGEADHDHIQRIEREIAAQGVSDEDRGDILHVAKVSADLYARLIDESSASGPP